jgi:hypothetical protein
MTGFEICARMLQILAKEVEGPYYGSEFFKFALTLAEASLQSPEMAAAVAETRNSLRDEIAERTRTVQVMLGRLSA